MGKGICIAFEWLKKQTIYVMMNKIVKFFMNRATRFKLVNRVAQIITTTLFNYLHVCHTYYIRRILTCKSVVSFAQTFSDLCPASLLAAKTGDEHLGSFQFVAAVHHFVVQYLLLTTLLR